MKRRNFLKNIGAAASIPMVLGGSSVYAFEDNPLFNTMAENADGKILVLVQLNGGNDGLNTLIPLDQYANLAKARANLLIPEDKVLKLYDHVGLHPAMSGIQNLYNDEKVCFIQSVGYPEPNFSHFRSTDIVTAASGSSSVVTSGWLGRHLESVHPGFPEGYPSEVNPHPIAITIGSSTSATCQGVANNMSVAIRNGATAYDLLSKGNEEVPDSNYGKQLSFVRQTMFQTDDYLEVISSAFSKAKNLSAKYPAKGVNKLADELKVVSRLIAGGLQTSVYVVNLGGFDTHANQVDEIEGVLVGKHNDLLTKLSQGIDAFQDDLKLHKVEDRVLGMTFSEFGRRIKSNYSYGCDHGAAYPLMLFGSKVNATIIGDNPNIASSVSKKDNLPMQYDFRSVYASVLNQWMGVSKATINSILMDEFQILPILKSEVGTDEVGINSADLDLNLYPNPVADQLNISFLSKGGRVKISLFNGAGQQIKHIITKRYARGTNKIALSTGNLLSGNYVVRLEEGARQVSKLLIKA